MTYIISNNAPKTEIRYNFETKKFSIYLSDETKLDKALATIENMKNTLKIA